MYFMLEAWQAALLVRWSGALCCSMRDVYCIHVCRVCTNPARDVLTRPLAVNVLSLVLLQYKGYVVICHIFLTLLL